MEQRLAYVPAQAGQFPIRPSPFPSMIPILGIASRFLTTHVDTSVKSNTN
jgi:hypothetical protein